MPHATLAPAPLSTQWRQPYWRHILESLHLAAARSAAQQPEVLLLPSGRGHVLRDAIGTELTCEAGWVWITQQGDPADITLSAGQRFRIDRRGETLALACGPCRLRIEPHRVGNA